MFLSQTTFLIYFLKWFDVKNFRIEKGAGVGAVVDSPLSPNREYKITASGSFSGTTWKSSHATEA